MGFAVAALGWRPREFWTSTPIEYWTAIKAYERFHKQPDE